jgi:hypothetical protein
VVQLTAPQGEDLALAVMLPASFLTERGRRHESVRSGGRMSGMSIPGSMMLSNRLALAVIPTAASVRLHGRMADVALEARAGRPRPLVDFGWALPVVSIFVTATFEGGTNSLPPEIQVGRVYGKRVATALAFLLTGFAVPFVLVAAATPYLASLADISMRRTNS